MRFNFIWALSLTFVLLGPSEAQSRSPLGTNLTGLDDWSTEFTFLDAFKTSRPWFSGSSTVWQDTRPLDLDARGWVRSLQSGQVARTLMLWVRKYPAGRYVVEYEGSGAIQYGQGARLVSSASGRDVIVADPSHGGIALSITRVDPANYIRNIHVWMPVNAPPGEIFYPLLLDRIKNYKTIRFMNWMLGQNGERYVQQHWEDRRVLEDARWNIKGAPVEVIAALCNRLGADPWFNIPHLADDNYVRQFARTTFQLLAPDRKVYIEHSNEVWNGIFPQAVYAQQQGLALGLSADPFQARILYNSLRSRQIFGIFEEVFPKNRLVRVIASFAEIPAVSQAELDFRDTLAHTDALAIAPYFGIRPQDQYSGMSVDTLFQQLQTTVFQHVMGTIQQQAAVARRHGIPLIAYEGGQSLVASGTLQNDPALNAVFDAANRDPRMGAFYSQWLNAWAATSGAGLLNHFTNCEAYSVWGRFGSLETLDDPRSSAPKYDALQRFIAGQ